MPKQKATTIAKMYIDGIEIPVTAIMVNEIDSKPMVDYSGISTRRSLALSVSVDGWLLETQNTFLFVEKDDYQEEVTKILGAL